MDYIWIADEFVAIFGNEQNEYSHSHYAIQLLIPIGKLNLNGKIISEQVLIDSNIQHYVYGEGKILSILFKPESNIGSKIKYKYLKDKSINRFYNHQISNAMSKLCDTSIDVGILQKVIITILGELVVDINLIEQLDDRIGGVINYIKFSGFEHLKYEDAINTIPLSKSRLTHLFKEEMGIPLMNYITWKKLINASKALLMSKDTITKVAYQYGFADSAHFSRLFKKNFGVSPRQLFKNKQKDSCLVQVFPDDLL